MHLQNHFKNVQAELERTQAELLKLGKEHDELELRNRCLESGAAQTDAPLKPSQALMWQVLPEVFCMSNACCDVDAHCRLQRKSSESLAAGERKSLLLFTVLEQVTTRWCQPFLLT